jgi:L-lactate dehydrogenase complex protein LldE
MLKIHYPRLLAGEDGLAAEAAAFAGRVHELVSFLVNVRGMSRVAARCEATATYHDSCSGLRELGVGREPRTLLASVAGLSLTEMPDAAECCGFGGLFATKHPEISAAIADKKISSAAGVKPDLLLAGDLGCLMHIAGRLRRAGSPIACRHVAEVLAGELDCPPIAAGAPP